MLLHSALHSIFLQLKSAQPVTAANMIIIKLSFYY